MADESKGAKAPPAPVLDETGPVPEIFVDGIHGIMVANGVAKLSFISASHDAASGRGKQKLVLRVTAPINALEGMEKSLAAIIANMKAAAAKK